LRKLRMPISHRSPFTPKSPKSKPTTKGDTTRVAKKPKKRK